MHTCVQLQHSICTGERRFSAKFLFWYQNQLYTQGLHALHPLHVSYANMNSSCPCSFTPRSSHFFPMISPVLKCARQPFPSLPFSVFQKLLVSLHVGMIQFFVRSLPQAIGHAKDAFTPNTAFEQRKCGALCTQPQFFVVSPLKNQLISSEQIGVSVGSADAALDGAIDGFIDGEIDGSPVGFVYGTPDGSLDT